MPRMLLLMVFSLLTDCGSSNEIQPRALSFEREYGSGSGVAFSSSSQQVYGPITAVQIYETSSYISGIGLRFGTSWAYYGGSSGTRIEWYLLQDEHITQVSGKTASYVNELIFLTNKGRMFRAGVSSGTSFNSFPLYSGSVLRFVSGRYSSSILTSIGFHWDHYHVRNRS
uniref:Zymogen granule membrane protein 16 isoform X1 n=1 Tax=Geotrypetes seraphini TaxID=260995 RepID=A0A6P8P214_GEOSA|nr:zymogen granule membrane protein 16 isoform X1 [Geotrypetes seraphini]